jgi:hypothetical protein
MRNLPYTLDRRGVASQLSSLARPSLARVVCRLPSKDTPSSNFNR